MRTNARRARFRLARTDHGVQKFKGKGKQVPRDVKGGTGKKRKRLDVSSSEDSDSAKSLSSSDSSSDSNSGDSE